ncbi:MAG: hypothetical protein WAT39_17980 [Planctomycetota bacterium]
MKRTLAALFVLLFALAGCLEVDGQDITIRYDAAADRIDLHFVHRGLFAEGGSGSDKDPLAKAVRDLADVRAGGEVVFWCNWPLTFDLTREYGAPAKAMLAHVDVENGGLFTDPQGVLCGHQFVRIREAKAFLKKLDLLLQVWVQSQLAGGTSGRGGRHQWDDDTKDLVREFVRSGEPFVAVEPGRLEFRLPLSANDHVWFKNQFERIFLDEMPGEVVRRIAVADRRAGGGDPVDTTATPSTVQVLGEQVAREIQRAPSFRFFWDNELCYVREPELTKFSFGVRGNSELRIKKASDGLWHPALLNKLREGGEVIEDGLPDQELARRFEAFQKRDAVLPPKVAELRGGGKGKEEAKPDAGK